MNRALLACVVLSSACGPLEDVDAEAAQVGVVRQAGKTGQGKTGQGKTGQGKTGQGATALGAGMVFAINRGGWQVRTAVSKGGVGLYTSGFGDLALYAPGKKTTQLAAVTSGGTTIYPATTTFAVDQTTNPLVRMWLQELDQQLQPATSLRELRVVNTWVDTSTDVNLLAPAYRAAFTGDPNQPNTDVRIYKLQVRSVADPNVWENFCQGEGVDGRAIFLPGVFTSSGQFVSSSQYLSVACLDGTAAKCMRWGYRPWRSLTPRFRSAVGLEPLWRACTKAASADYCSTGHGYTDDGRRIDLWDRYGFITKSPETMSWSTNGIPDAYSDESAFDEQGTVCLVRERLYSITAETAVCPMTQTFLQGNEGCVDPLSGTWSACGPKGLISSPTNVFDRHGTLTCDRVATRPPLVYVASVDSGCTHSPLDPGDALAVDCNQLTQMVCTLDRAACCAEDDEGHLLPDAWDARCINIASHMLDGTWTPPAFSL